MGERKGSRIGDLGGGKKFWLNEICQDTCSILYRTFIETHWIHHLFIVLFDMIHRNPSFFHEGLQ
ncbi:MAG: hypothetical protein DBY42_06075 [Bacillota bacterium]|nr:MAG: hypothetical protein DBY42_06075 [Bacillota bacterium]